MAIYNLSGGGENVTPEVQTQTPLIEDIKESLVGKATGANATEDTILEGYSAYVGQELVVGKYKPHGLYVWKKYEYESSTVGNFVDYVVSDTETEYPDGDVKDGYWYEKVVEGAIGIDYGTVTTTSNRASITVNHNLGVYPTYVGLWMPSGIIAWSTTGVFDNLRIYGSSASQSTAYPQKGCTKSATSVIFSCNDGTNYPFKPGTYVWIVIA